MQYFRPAPIRFTPFRGLGRSAPGRYQQHDVVGQKPVLEFIGPGLEQISFDMRFDVGLGINPIAEIDKLARSPRCGHHYATDHRRKLSG